MYNYALLHHHPQLARANCWCTGGMDKIVHRSSSLASEAVCSDVQLCIILLPSTIDQSDLSVHNRNRQNCSEVQQSGLRSCVCYNVQLGIIVLTRVTCQWWDIAAQTAGFKVWMPLFLKRTGLDRNSFSSRFTFFFFLMLLITVFISFKTSFQQPNGNKSKTFKGCVFVCVCMCFITRLKMGERG